MQPDRDAPRSYFEKAWQDHVIAELGDDTVLLHIDRHFLHELSGAMSFRDLDRRGLKVRHRALTFSTIDHVVATSPGRRHESLIPGGAQFIQGLIDGTRRHGVRLYDTDDPRQGIVHVIAPELGAALPGCTLVCGDSHTTTPGGVGALSWGIGSSDGEHVLATQTLVVTRPKSMRIRIEGELPHGVFAKDLALAVIARLGAGSGAGYAVEYAGSAIRALPVEGRLTLCNMAVEMSARLGFVAPDEQTFAYLKGRRFAPKGAMWDRAVAYWRALASAPGAAFDAEHTIDITGLQPQVTWGTSPEHAAGVHECVPALPADASPDRQRSHAKALEYMGLQPGDRLEGLPVQAAFIGSCTNSRLADLRIAARVLQGRRVADGVRAICVPGSATVKRAAEEEGIHRVFQQAGFEWREPGCSLCMSAGGESFGPRERVITTTNRNFEDRQGPRTRSHLASPATVAASAVRGRVADPRPFL
jgi:3-isopropylmalate/(R)-2-methylmalate dehydratase large subunit